MNLGIKNKVAVVTGGATGIGYAIAFDLATTHAGVSETPIYNSNYKFNSKT